MSTRGLEVLRPTWATWCGTVSNSKINKYPKHTVIAWFTDSFLLTGIHSITAMSVKHISTFLLLSIFYCFKSCFGQEGLDEK